MSERGQGLMATPEQLRAARAILGLSQSEIAAMTGKTTKTIRRAENSSESVAPETVEAIRSVLEGAGVIFLDPGNFARGYGVCRVGDN